MDINDLSADEAFKAFMRCCSCTKWSKQMVDQRPFTSRSQLIEKAGNTWFSLDQNDWEEAFDGHSKIGNLNSLKEKYINTTEWATQEQAGLSQATEQLLLELKECNNEYEKRFGFIFLVNATGKGIQEIMSILQKRLNSTLKEEIKIAATEQSKITAIRLEKLL